MSELRAPRWLETELSRHLAGTEAPDSLWDRLRSGAGTAPAQTAVWAKWPVAAMLTLMTAAGMLWLNRILPQPGQMSAARAFAQSCAPPAGDPIERLVAVSARKMPETAGGLPITEAHAAGQIGCYQCHSTVFN